jgi:hypothetical protein
MSVQVVDHQPKLLSGWKVNIRKFVHPIGKGWSGASLGGNHMPPARARLGDT